MLRCTIYYNLFIFLYNSEVGDDDLKSNKHKSAVKKIERFFNSPELMLPEKFLLEFNSLGELAVKGCVDVNEYFTENILLTSEIYYINIKGKDLFMKQFSEKDTVIGGIVESINFIKR